jgi:hypothetical protein
MTTSFPFTTTQQRFLEKVEICMKEINNLCFPKSPRLKSAQVLCKQVNDCLVVSINDRNYYAKSLLVAIENFDIDADSEDYLSIWDYLKSCELPR